LSDALLLGVVAYTLLFFLSQSPFPLIMDDTRLFQILDKSEEYVGIIASKPKYLIASATEKSSDSSCIVIMIHTCV
jgi:hypothetical protein